MPDQHNLGALVQSWTDGDRGAFDQVVEILYEDLRAIAHRHLRLERDGHTLSTTALVHEAYLELARRTGPSWQGRAQLLALVSKVMRHLLIDYARRRNRTRRGGHAIRLPIDEDRAGANAEIVELLALDEALALLEARDARMARIVECRFFAGMTDGEIAQALEVTARTVQRDWLRAKAWLQRSLESPAGV